METLTTERKIHLRTTTFAWFISGFIALLLPGSYYLFGYQTIRTTNLVETEMTADRISKLISTNPSMWMFLEDRIYDQFSRRPLREDQQIYCNVYDSESNIVFSYGDLLPSPNLTGSSSLYNASIFSGRVEITRSLSPLLNRTFFVFIAGLLIGLGIYFFLRQIPIKALEKSINLLIAEKQRLEVIFRNIGEGIVTTDLEGRILLCNREFIDLVEYSRDRIQQLTIDELIEELVKEPPSHERQGSIQERVLQNQKPYTVLQATKVITRSGKSKTITCSGAPLVSDENQTGVVYVIKDITEMMLTQDKINKIAQLENLGVVAGGIAHDFNNFLSTIMAKLSSIKAMIPPEDSANEIIESSEESILRARDLTEQLITFSRGGELQLETSDIREILQRESEFMLSGSRVEIVYNFDTELWAADIDAVQFSQMIQNLVVNAVQAMEKGGTLQVTAKNRTLEDDANLFQLVSGPYIELTIEDNGVGISPENISKIFIPFFSHKKQGSGLGLAVVDNVVRRHGGNISVSSQPGEGTVFTILLPAAPEKLLPSELEQSTLIFERNHVFGEKKILFMDDNTDLVSTLTKYFNPRGYQMVQAMEGVAAIDMYLEAMRAGTPFDLVILDLTIPGGLGGKETIAELLKLDPGIKAIVTSGYSDNPIMANFAEYGFKGVLRKPFRIDSMLNMIENL